MLIIAVIIAAMVTGIAANWIIESEEKPAPVRIPVMTQDRIEMRRRGR